VRPALRSLVVLLAVLAIYYAVPVGELPSGEGLAFSVVVVVVGCTVIARLVIDQLRRQLSPAGREEVVRVQSLVFLVYATVLLFALVYTGMAEASDHQFVGLETKTDGLYFTVTTLATVGFGDIHARGQVARAIVTLQIVFNLVFVGALASMVTGAIRERASRGGFGDPGRPGAPGDVGPPG
jgi:hypothetical protein